MPHVQSCTQERWCCGASDGAVVLDGSVVLDGADHVSSLYSGMRTLKSAKQQLSHKSNCRRTTGTETATDSTRSGLLFRSV